MNKKRIQLGVIITLVGIFFAVTSYLIIQDLENNIYSERNEYTKGIGILNSYTLVIGLLTSIIGIFYTFYGFIPHKETINRI